MDVQLIITLFLIGFTGSFISGVAGIGGSIINYPMLLYIPPLVGVGMFSSHEVTGITGVQVLFATIGGILAYRKSGYLHVSLIIYMGVSVLIGSLIGGFGSRMMEEQAINIIYGILALSAVALMFIPTKGREGKDDEIPINKSLASLLAFIVGVGAGIVGAGGAFLLVPIMLVILKIPSRVTIASSLAITFISSIGATIGKVATGQVLFFPALIMVISSLVAAPLGAQAGKKVNTKVLRWILALLIGGTSIKIWTDILF
ncbi:sulfite exporter TauE/SafE family protein [Evansella halocellulosilytica]|uniref:sulfite exporter TauE/SafE family protein n=1 Tax=Evansella halocellulosilytica TaxID=2011013 RepID=UPI000BB7B287|nr:sulfite exporter TauE/SafE family protein [Evansella halocellulosilytica]